MKNKCDFCLKEANKTYPITERSNEGEFIAKKQICLACCEPKTK